MVLQVSGEKGFCPLFAGPADLHLVLDKFRKLAKV
jgi:hypothetical protein